MSTFYTIDRRNLRPHELGLGDATLATPGRAMGPVAPINWGPAGPTTPHAAPDGLTEKTFGEVIEGILVDSKVQATAVALVFGIVIGAGIARKRARSAA